MIDQSLRFVVAAVFGFAAVATVGGALIQAWRSSRRPAPVRPAPGPFVTVFRYCPHELRRQTAVLHADGTALCQGCGAHLPAGDS